MEDLRITIGADELLGLRALSRLDGSQRTAAVTSGTSDAIDIEQFQTLARLAMRDGLAGRLRKVDLPWAPSAEQVEKTLRARGQRNGAAPSAAAPAETPSRVRSLRSDSRLKVGIAAAALVLSVVVLIGGYGAGWAWTGFQANNQLWDWLHLLLLPVAFALLPVWLRYSEHMGRTRKLTLSALVAAFWVFVAVGYLVPLHWTGFSGNSLWDWLVLIVLPVTLVTVRAWPTTSREISATHIAVFTTFGIAWVVTLIGGYGGSWKWTGYPGNTLWEWLQLLLLPIVFPTILLPAFLRWTSGGAAQRAKEMAARQAGASDEQAPPPAGAQP
ncbi:MAG TPA: hypothetical protein VIX85_10050 [Acidimicrobiales bacterium]